MNEAIKNKPKTKFLIKQFKERQQQKTIEQALVYLKLKQFNCPTKSALVFSQKKQKNIDSTLRKDGPANFRQLIPKKPDGIIYNGWLKGQKLKYQSTCSFNNYLRDSANSLSSRIDQFYKKPRNIEENERLRRTKSSVNVNLQNPKASIQKIIAIKENIMKQRELNAFVFRLKGVEFPQMTKIYSQDIAQTNINGLVVKAGAFQNCVNDPQIEYVPTDENFYSRNQQKLKETLSVTSLDKRNEILNYKNKILQMTEITQITDNQSNKNLDSKQDNEPIKKNKSLSLNRTVLNNNFYKNRLKLGKKDTQVEQFQSKVEKLIKKEYFTQTYAKISQFRYMSQQRPKLKTSSTEGHL